MGDADAALSLYHLLDPEVLADPYPLYPSSPAAPTSSAVFVSARSPPSRWRNSCLRRGTRWRCWRCSGALKARGDGLAGLTDGGLPEDPRWSVRALEPSPGYAGALAAWGHGWHLGAWRWEWCQIELAEQGGRRD